MAHPTELRKKEGLDNAALVEIIEKLGALGLQTLEVDGFRNGICPGTGLRQTDVFLKMLADYNARNPERLPLIATSGSDCHNQPGEGLEMGGGKNRNLRAELGAYAVINSLRSRHDKLLSE